jgi:hypothetical protein
MLEHSSHGAPPLVAAPRHLRRRRMHAEIADALLVSGTEPIPVRNAPAQAPGPAGQDAATPDAATTDTEGQDAATQAAAIREKESQQLIRDMQYRRKRRVALLAVLCVAIAVPAIVLALLLG